MLVYSPGTLPAFPTAKGFPVLFVYNNPALRPNTGDVTAFCSHQDHRLFQYGVSLDNPATGASEAGTALLTNDSAAVTEAFFTQVTRLGDLDTDGTENQLDTCLFEPDNDFDGVDDQADPIPSNPRLVAPPGDPDADGLPTGCDRPEGLAPSVGECGLNTADDDFDGKVNDGCAALGMVESGAQCDDAVDNDADTTVNDGCPAIGDPNVPSPPGSGPDQDGDHIPNDSDNCPDAVNADQTDSDVDDIGNPCDPQPAQPSGSAQTVENGTPVCTNGTDMDHDGYCADIDPSDSFSNSPDADRIVPEASAFDPQVCSDSIDNDIDGPIDVADTGCGDLDIDRVINELDNCPLTTNGPDQANIDGVGNQTDSDADGQVNSQPFQRSDSGQPTGPVSTVIGEPFQRSDHWGGDACDPDDDNEYLPDPSEATSCGSPPHPGRTDPDCDDDTLLDWWEYQWPACLSMTTVNIATANGDNDALFTYGEAVIGTDPCVSGPGSGQDPADFTNDQDGDGYKSGPERYLGSDRLDRCGLGDWPAERSTVTFPLNSLNKINLPDLQTFISPRRLGTSPGDVNYAREWDIAPGPGVFAKWINLADLQSMALLIPPMPPFNGTTRAFNGAVCTE